nr:SMI1/KNR4 family protein [Flavobacterium sp. ASV13]
MKKIFNRQQENIFQFCIIETKSKALVFSEGKAGDTGGTQAKLYTTEEECRQKAEELIQQKIAEGYVEATEILWNEASIIRADFYGTWTSNKGYSVVITADAYEIWKGTKMLSKVSPITWYPKANSNRKSKADYPYGYVLHGLEEEEARKDPDKWWGGMSYSCYLHTHKKTLCNGAGKILTPKGQSAIADTIEQGETQAQKAKQLLNELDQWLQENGIEERVLYGKPVTQKEIQKAEKKLGVKLPPSYTAFVTNYGAFEIDGELTGRGSGNSVELLSPDQITEETTEQRTSINENYDDECPEKEIINDGLLFCGDPIGEFYYTYVISSTDATGEMNARGFDCDDFGTNDHWHEGDMTFYTVVEEIVEQIKEKNA